MSGWYKVNLGDALTAEAELEKIKEAFARLSPHVAQHADAAIFIRHENEGGVHCNVIAYFSPAIETLARTFNAEACIRPVPDGLSLFVGSTEADENISL